MEDAVTDEVTMADSNVRGKKRPVCFQIVDRALQCPPMTFGGSYTGPICVLCKCTCSGIKAADSQEMRSAFLSTHASYVAAGMP